MPLLPSMLTMAKPSNIVTFVGATGVKPCSIGERLHQQQAICYCEKSVDEVHRIEIARESDLVSCRRERWAMDGRKAEQSEHLSSSFDSSWRVMPGMILCYRPSSHSFSCCISAAYHLLLTACIHPICFTSPQSCLVRAYILKCSLLFV